MKSGNLNFLESSGPLQACNGTALPFFFFWACVSLKDSERPKAIIFCEHRKLVKLPHMFSVTRIIQLNKAQRPVSHGKTVLVHWLTFGLNWRVNNYRCCRASVMCSSLGDALFCNFISTARKNPKSFRPTVFYLKSFTCHKEIITEKDTI